MSDVEAAGLLLPLEKLREVSRVLKKGGKFLLIVVVLNYFTFMLFSVISRIKLISVREWMPLFKEADFRCLSDDDINGGHFFLLEKTA